MLRHEFAIYHVLSDGLIVLISSKVFELIDWGDWRGASTTHCGVIIVGQQFYKRKNTKRLVGLNQLFKKVYALLHVHIVPDHWKQFFQFTCYTHSFVKKVRMRVRLTGLIQHYDLIKVHSNIQQLPTINVYHCGMIVSWQIVQQPARFQGSEQPTIHTVIVMSQLCHQMICVLSIVAQA
jgi:hypothetical protein